ncbi:hypothetical protein [Pseudoalteromonas rubra]|uniref:Uncharacterized protein n=1 Tax=Pseudoalteromonas rubra TaxID=43658 RepID=A0A0U3I337_9GAMM|nr:hypothetical protein [Pseudoalteromonas rubra]ALU44358.1 hypothetical protein AT705_16175 [Pseudoalteromonas rubra]
MQVIALLLLILPVGIAFSASDRVVLEKECTVSNLEHMTENNVNNCIEFMRVLKEDDYKKFTKKAVELGFLSPLVDYYINPLFDDPIEYKERLVYRGAYKCYPQLESLVYRIEKKKGGNEHLLWELLVKMNNSKYKFESRQTPSFSLEELRQFFSRFDC